MSFAGKFAPESGLQDPTDPIGRLDLLNARTLTIVHEAQEYLTTPELADVIPDAR